MGKFAPNFLAFVLNCSGVYIFRAPKNMDYFPYLSYVIFLFSIFFMLWDLSLRPVYFRRLYFWAEFIIEFIIAMCIMELIMIFFWLPLEITIIRFLPRIPKYVEEMMHTVGFKCQTICKAFQFFKWRGTLVAVSYLLSIFFFLCLIHATRVVDFTLLRCGGREFLSDSKERGQRFCKRMFKSLMPIKGKDNCKQVYLHPYPEEERISPNRSTEDGTNPSICKNDELPDDFCECSSTSSRGYN